MHPVIATAISDLEAAIKIDDDIAVHYLHKVVEKKERVAFLQELAEKMAAADNDAPAVAAEPEPPAVEVAEEKHPTSKFAVLEQRVHTLLREVGSPLMAREIAERLELQRQVVHNTLGFLKRRGVVTHHSESRTWEVAP